MDRWHCCQVLQSVSYRCDCKSHSELSLYEYNIDPLNKSCIWGIFWGRTFCSRITGATTHGCISLHTTCFTKRERRMSVVENMFLGDVFVLDCRVWERELSDVEWESCRVRDNRGDKNMFHNNTSLNPIIGWFEYIHTHKCFLLIRWSSRRTSTIQVFHSFDTNLLLSSDIDLPLFRQCSTWAMSTNRNHL